MAVEGGTVSHCYSFEICKFIGLMSLSRHSLWFAFSFKQFASTEFGICNIQLRIVDENCQSYGVQQCFDANLRKVKVTSLYRVGNSCNLFIN